MGASPQLQAWRLRRLPKNPNAIRPVIIGMAVMGSGTTAVASSAVSVKSTLLLVVVKVDRIGLFGSKSLMICVAPTDARPSPVMVGSTREPVQAAVCAIESSSVTSTDHVAAARSIPENAVMIDLPNAVENRAAS